eukprot:6187464-Pleurochrysis_carterae.AAC.1
MVRYTPNEGVRSPDWAALNARSDYAVNIGAVYQALLSRIFAKKEQLQLAYTLERFAMTGTHKSAYIWDHLFEHLAELVRVHASIALLPQLVNAPKHRVDISMRMADEHHIHFSLLDSAALDKPCTEAKDPTTFVVGCIIVHLRMRAVRQAELRFQKTFTCRWRQGSMPFSLSTARIRHSAFEVRVAGEVKADVKEMDGARLAVEDDTNDVQLHDLLRELVRNFGGRTVLCGCIAF